MGATHPALHQIRRAPNAVSRALDHVAGFVAAERVMAGDLLAVIVDELVCNLLDHGCDDAADGWIGLALWRSPEGVRVRLTDGCAPFDPRDAAPPPELPPDHGGGAGLAIVRAWCRILSYRREGGRNILDLLLPD